MVLTEALFIALATALVNGAVTWGVVSVKLEWLRSDVDAAHERLDALGAPPRFSVRRQKR